MTSLTTSGTPSIDDAVRQPLMATYVAFASAGMLMSTWASRIPQVRDKLQLQPSELGFVLLAIACGSRVSLPLSGPMVAHRGSRQVVATMAMVFGMGLATVAIGQEIGVGPG